MALMKESIIETKDLTKKYTTDSVALDHITLSIEAGDIFGFLGHNGAGKTTTINILTTLLEPTSGTAQVGGFDVIKNAFEIKRIIGYVPENVQLYGSLSSQENLEYFARLSGIRDPKKAIREITQLLDIGNYLDKRVQTLSKGMRQRIGLAQAILHNPKVLFLDEPTSGLDPIGVKQLRDIIVRLNTEKGMTIFMNTHLLSEVSKTCKTIGILNQGKLVYKGSLADATHTFKNEQALEDMYITTQKHESV
jgi:ABC-2 type transport system ATP-binding protein